MWQVRTASVQVMFSPGRPRTRLEKRCPLEPPRCGRRGCTGVTYWFGKRLATRLLKNVVRCQQFTPGEIRSRENDGCVGGLRNPSRWVARTPSARALGLFLRHFLDQELQQRPREIDQVHAIELHGCEPVSSQFVDSARHTLKVALQVKDGPHPGRMAMTLTSSKHCSVRVVILRLRFQVGFVRASL